MLAGVQARHFFRDLPQGPGQPPVAQPVRGGLLSPGNVCGRVSGGVQRGQRRPQAAA